MTIAAGGIGRLDGEAFLRLLVTQLRHQDPLQPVADREFMAQLAQLTQVERLTGLEQAMERVADALERARRADRWGAAASLLGRDVELAGGERVRVTGVGGGQEGIWLLLADGRRVGLEDVRAVLEARTQEVDGR